jgi:mannose-6-phosphate isomerase-like protein (cupin superfamily)
MNSDRAASVLDFAHAREKLDRSGGGMRIAYSSPNLEIRVEVFTSPGPGEVRLEECDLIYLALEGSGVLGVETDDVLALVPGEAIVVPAGTRHVLFGNLRLTLLTVATPGWTAYGVGTPLQRSSPTRI